MTTINQSQSRSRSIAKDVRNLDVTEVCGFREWLTNYMRLEANNASVFDREQLALVEEARELASDISVFVAHD